MSQPRVLLVDDDKGFRRLVRSLVLEQWPQAEVLERDPLTSGLSAEDYRGDGFDVVLLDYQLGPTNGFDYLRRFRTNPAFPPVIMLTGEGSERLAVDAIKLGATDYISKQTMTFDALTGAIQSALDARGAADRQEQLGTPALPGDQRPPDIKGLRILNALGEGGMAKVYLAERTRTGEQVVLKVFDHAKAGASGDEQLQRFSREYDIVRRLDHPGIVRLFEQGFTDDQIYIAMEYFPNGSLRERLRQALAPAEALRYAGAVCAALEAVHQAGVVHRDLKPGNIMFRDERTPVLIDFGVAKSLAENHELTRAGVIVGTPHYISPEQIDGVALDGGTDLYSLGALLFEMLTGHPPYTARTTLAVLYKHRHAPIPDLPEPLAALQPILARLLAKVPGERFRSAAEAGAALDSALGGFA